MNSLIFPILIVSSIGLISGLGLSIASIIMNVPKDELTEKIENILPGANCGSCGYSGCSGYAKALAKREAGTTLCSPGGEKVANQISNILGVKAEKIEKKVAILNCMGSSDNTQKKMAYQGINSCSAAVQLFGGSSLCDFGCLGLGDCVNSCEYNAINICNGIANINFNNCKGCSKCVNTCPKHLISIIPLKKQAVVLCSNCDKGAQTNKVCKVGCIGCMRCVKACEHDAIKVENFLARVNPDKCIGCGKCLDECKRGCITLI